MKLLIALIVSIALTGCMTCRDHPLACSIAGAIVVGSVAATVAANSSDRDHARSITAHYGACVPQGAAPCAP